MSKTNYNIAVFLDSVDPLFIPLEYQKQCYIIVGKDTPLFYFAKSLFSEDKLIPVTMHSVRGYDIPEKAILYNDEFLKLMQEKQITHLVIPSSCTKVMKDWADKYDITLIGIAYDRKVNLENKIDFDDFLKRYHIESPSTIKFTDLQSESIDPFGYVVQAADSGGLEGTWLFRSKNEVMGVVNENSANKFLIREYLSGMPIGASIFIDHQGNYFFSAFRSQCFSYKDGFPSTFLGVQWLPTNFFTEEMTKNIYDVLTQIAEKFIANTYKGVFNIDMILHENKPYVLECNPRLSAATAQVFSVSGLTGYSDPYRFFLNSFLDLKNNTVLGATPVSEYNGSLLAINIQDIKKVKNIPSIGVYEFSKKGLVFIPGITRIEDINNQIFMLHYMKQPGIYKEHTEMCSVVAPMALFDLASGNLNSKGQTVFDYFRKEFFGKIV